METKKSPQADLENKKNYFFEIGMILSLVAILVAFNLYRQVKPSHKLGEVSIRQVEEEIMPITRVEKPEVVVAPPPSPRIIEILNIVNDEVKIEDELQIEESEATAETRIDVHAVSQIAQKEEEEKEEQQIFVVVEDMPEFPGGELGLRTYIASALRYPSVAQENGIQGTVFVGFVVDRDGSISNAKVIRGVDPYLDKEALRVINSLPKWKPGKQRGKAVRVSYSVPIHFVLK